MDYFYAELQKINSAASRIRTKAGEYRSTADQLIRAVENSPGWQGADAEAFHSQVAGFREDMENMAKLMESYANMVEKAGKYYRQIQDKAVAQAKRLW